MPPNNRPPQGYFSTPAKGYVGVPEDEFEKKYGPTPAGKTVIGMSGNKPIYGNEGEDVAVAERKRWEEKYGKIDPNKTLIGTRDNKNLYEGDPNTGGGYTPTPEENSAVFQELENTGGYSPKTEVMGISGENKDPAKEMSDKQRDLASRLWKARQAGQSKKDAVTSESGVDIDNIQKGSIDIKMGTGLTEEKISAFADRLYAGVYDSNKKQETTEATTATTNENKSSPNLSGSRLLDRYDALQGTPMGSVSIGAKGVQGATGGLARGSSPTGGTPIGGGGGGIGTSPFGTRSSSARRMNNIAAANLFFAAEERRRQLEEQAAKEKGFNMIYGNQSPSDIRAYERPVAKMPFYEAATYNIR